MARVSIVLVAYNMGDALIRCLASIPDRDDYEVIVVNNGDRCARIDSLGRASHVTLVLPPENLGFAAGCNLGARLATGDTLVFLNPDTVVGRGAIESLVETLEDASVAIAMARLKLMRQPELLHSDGIVMHISGLGWSGGYGTVADGAIAPRDVPSANGAAMAIRTDAFDDLGGFRDDFFLYLEDVELGWRARMLGGRVVVDPRADVYHDYDYARHSCKQYFMERNRLAFLFTCFQARTLLLLAPILLAAELAMLFVAFRQRWLGDKLAGWAWVFRNASALAAGRREVQRTRRLRDRELARFLTAVVDPGMLRVPALIRALNPLVVGYWAVARRVI